LFGGVLYPKQASACGRGNLWANRNWEIYDKNSIPAKDICIPPFDTRSARTGGGFLAANPNFGYKIRPFNKNGNHIFRQKPVLC
jgi:hypothetical protein